jgi:hypothetical protein
MPGNLSNQMPFLLPETKCLTSPLSFSLHLPFFLILWLSFHTHTHHYTTAPRSHSYRKFVKMFPTFHGSRIFIQALHDPACHWTGAVQPTLTVPVFKRHAKLTALRCCVVSHVTMGCSCSQHSVPRQQAALWGGRMVYEHLFINNSHRNKCLYHQTTS